MSDVDIEIQNAIMNLMADEQTLTTATVKELLREKIRHFITDDIIGWYVARIVEDRIF